MSRHIRNTTLILLISIVILGVSGAGQLAGADPIGDKRAQAKAIQDQIDANGERISALAEQFNAAQIRLDDAERAVADAQARIDAARAEVERIKHLVDLRAASVYQRSVQGKSVTGFDFTDARNLLTRRHYADTQASSDNQLLDKLARGPARPCVGEGQRRARSGRRG